MDAAELKRRIAQARQRLGSAENEMEGALKKLGGHPSNDKSIISEALGAAFAELKAARQDLLDLEEVVAKSE
jgi:hypothetical protein